MADAVPALPPEPSREACARAIAGRLERRLGTTSHVVEGDGGSGVWWLPPYPEGGTPTAAFIALVDGKAVQGMRQLVWGDTLSAPDIRAARKDDINRLIMSSVSRRVMPGGAGPEANAVIGRIVGTLDVMAVHVMMTTGVRIPEALELLASDRPHAPTLRAFARAHPWLILLATASPDEAREAAATGDPDAVAERLVRLLCPDAATARRAPRIVEALRGQPHLVRPAPGSLALLATLPPETFDVPDAKGYVPQVLHQACLAADTLARASGRAPASVLGRVPASPDYLPRLARRGGHSPDPAGAGAAIHGILDLVRAFDSDVIAPARAALGRRQPWEPDGDIEIGDMPLGDPGLATAIRVLLGQRTLPALVEVSARWHARADGMARSLADATAGRTGEGHRLCPDIRLAGSFYLTCLVSVGELVDEGAPGPDATGALGLDHCVGSYAREVVTGGSHVLSLRRRLPEGGYERFSTAEVRLDDGVEVVQHRGRGNAEPTAGMETMLRLALDRVTPEQVAAARAFEPAPDAWPDPLAMAAEPGMWERMRDAWAFALPRPLRAAGPAELLAYGGEHG